MKPKKYCKVSKKVTEHKEVEKLKYKSITGTTPSQLSVFSQSVQKTEKLRTGKLISENRKLTTDNWFK